MKNLLFVCHLFILTGMAVSVIKEYIYDSQSMSWIAAQNYCKQNFGDLASIATKEENQKAVTVGGPTNPFVAWIGIKRVIPHVNVWKWSDGETSNYTNWKTNEPDDRSPGEDCAVMTPQGWCDTGCSGSFTTFCSRRFTLVNERKTWEEALHYCRSNYIDLAFVDSAKLLGLLKTETGQAQTARVWMGLRFLSGTWFWVNGMPLGSLVSLPSCPVQPYRCGAHNFNTFVWENRDCNEERNFFCYY